MVASLVDLSAYRAQRQRTPPRRTAHPMRRVHPQRRWHVEARMDLTLNGQRLRCWQRTRLESGEGEQARGYEIAVWREGWDFLRVLQSFATEGEAEEIRLRREGVMTLLDRLYAITLDDPA